MYKERKKYNKLSETLRLEIGQRLRKFSEENFRKKTELARMLEIPASTLSQIMAGKRPLSQSLILRLLQAGVDINWLLTGEKTEVLGTLDLRKLKTKVFQTGSEIIIKVSEVEESFIN